MAQTQADAPPAEPTAAAIIDVDVHPVLDPTRLAARLPQPWRRRFESGNRGPGGPGGYWNPNGVRRSDAVLDDGEEIANHPRSLIERFLDPHGIAACVLNLDGTSFTMSPEAEFAAAAVSAANDAMVEEWLEADGRFRASVLVSPTDPVRAAAEVRRVGSHPGFVQVMLPSGSPMGFGHRWYDPIYEAAAECGLPMAVHPGTEGV
ncbi:MAG TPA: amidohydrolase family protein, partial [Candidatus Dormibacteraeota bacterium]|nr:amidohydrolase family protein [Candidatus Dormibacteraeota bacterium]